jgi:hypothetical protein
MHSPMWSERLHEEVERAAMQSRTGPWHEAAERAAMQLRTGPWHEAVERAAMQLRTGPWHEAVERAAMQLRASSWYEELESVTTEVRTSQPHHVAGTASPKQADTPIAVDADEEARPPLSIKASRPRRRTVARLKRRVAKLEAQFEVWEARWFLTQLETPHPEDDE